MAVFANCSFYGRISIEKQSNNLRMFVVIVMIMVTVKGIGTSIIGREGGGGLYSHMHDKQC